MIQSMTAFARAEKTMPDVKIAIEMRTYNSKYLDIHLRIPPTCLTLEEKIKRLISEKLDRGRIELKLFVKDDREETIGFEVNQTKAKAYAQAIQALQRHLQLEETVPLEFLLRQPDLIEPREDPARAESLWPTIRDCLSAALEDLTAMRQREGSFIAEDFNTRLQMLETSLDRIAAEAHNLSVIYRDRLQERIGALTQGLVDIDPARIAQEAAFLADRSDISEEIVRARSHLEQFRRLMGAPEPAGRKLNFLLQELNREFNTMSAKAGNADVSHTIVAVKSELEKIREQVQNIE